ncbi:MULTISPECIES: hypothetical protein [unclassified Cupriavidus]|uniref:hypothetical protein n=1 Tax=unclassified Cupriavidus TaxID=2640874 RepID=UPI00313E3408
MSGDRKATGTFLWIYGAPLWLAAIGLVGLAAALFADGIWDWISWIALGAMTATGLWYALKPAARAREAAPRRAATLPGAEREPRADGR